VALIETAWATGGRRRSELAGLRIEDLDRSAFEADGTITLRLRETKTHKKAPPLPLLLTGRAARALDLWQRASGVKDGAVFRALTRPDRHGAAKVLDRRLTPIRVT
jgi:integrase